MVSYRGSDILRLSPGSLINGLEKKVACPLFLLKQTCSLQPGQIRQTWMNDKALPIVILDREDATRDIEFWKKKTPEERLDAVEFLREQCYLAMGIQQEPRMVRELRVVEKQR